MADQTLLALFQELMEEFDSSIDTTEGSAFRTTVMDPFLERIGDSPLDVDLEEFLVTRLQEEFPNLDVSTFSGIRDLVIRPMVAMLEPFQREVKGIKISQSLANVDSMTRDEVNALLANFFTELEDGAKSSGTVRLFFSAPQSVVVTSLTQFSTSAGLNFFPTATQSITSSSMTFNQSGSLYYFDVSVEAENPGEQYNVEAGDINTVGGIPGVVRVSNTFAFTSGLDEESKQDGVARARESITIRNLSTKRGIRTVISDAFDFADTIQVVGYRDAEMDRDLLRGPANISLVPDRVFEGDQNPDLSPATQVHIGGKTDVYVYQQDLVDDTLDIENLTDSGLRVFASETGFTSPSSTGTVTTFEDRFGNFTKNGVQVGDYLRLGGETGFEQPDLRQILSVAPSALGLDDTVSSALFERAYEILRFDDTHETLYISLYDLVAENGDGNPVSDGDGDPVQAVPGDPDLTALSISSVLVKKEENIAENNIVLPLVWIESIEFLDPLTLDPTGDEIPMGEVLLALTPDGFTGGSSTTKAGGRARLFFRDAVNVWFPPDVRFTVGSVVYKVDFSVSGSAQITGGELELVGDFTSTISKGYRILFGTIYTVMEDPVYNSGSGRTELVVRETIGADTGVSSFSAFVGQLQETAGEDEFSGLFYADVNVTALLNGADGNQDEETELAVTGVQVEGWRLRSVYSVHSFSTRDLPYLHVSRFVNDSTDLRDASTAYAVRLNYKSAPSLVDVQDFVDDDDNRIVAEDILVRHFLPALVRGNFVVDSDVDSEAALEALAEYINTLSPEENLEVSDLVGLLRDEGATYTRLPVTLTVLRQEADRTWSAEVVEDRVVSSRVQHFIADEDLLTVESES